MSRLVIGCDPGARNGAIVVLRHTGGSRWTTAAAVAWRSVARQRSYRASYTLDGVRLGVEHYRERDTTGERGEASPLPDELEELRRVVLRVGAKAEAAAVELIVWMGAKPGALQLADDGGRLHGMISAICGIRPERPAWSDWTRDLVGDVSGMGRTESARAAALARLLSARGVKLPPPLATDEHAVDAAWIALYASLSARRALPVLTGATP